MTTQHYVRAEFPVPPRFWEPLVTYSFLAAHTTTLRFGTGVLVLPMRRDIVVTAKQIATLDHFSNGRVEIGVGVGAYREEFEALNPDGQVHRGDMVEEGVQRAAAVVLRAQRLVRRQVLQVQGCRAVSEAEADAPADLFRRQQSQRICAARPSAPTAGFRPGLPLETLRRMVGELKQMTEAAGRKFSDIQIAPQYVVHLGRDQDKAIARYKRKPDVQAFRVAEEVDAQGPGARPSRRTSIWSAASRPWSSGRMRSAKPA